MAKHSRVKSMAASGNPAVSCDRKTINILTRQTVIAVLMEQYHVSQQSAELAFLKANSLGSTMMESVPDIKGPLWLTMADVVGDMFQISIMATA